VKRLLHTLKQNAKQLKKEIYTLFRVYTHAGVPWYIKLFLLLIIAYALSPIDLIPDFIPVFGLLDDLILIPLGVILAMKMIPSNIWNECRLKADEGLDINKSYGLYGAGIIIIFWLIIAAWALKSFYGTLIDFNFMKILSLLIGSFLAALISGAAGFGGALLLLPVLSWAIGPVTAVPVLTLAQLIGNLSRVYAGFKEISWKPVMVFIATAVPFSVIGALSFVSLPKELIMRIIGACVVIFALLKYYKILKFNPGNNTLLAGGGVTGLLSGLVGSAGPIGAAVFLSLNLSPMGYIASEAVTATVMHIVKTIIYQKYVDIGLTEVGVALGMGVFMVLVTMAGKKVIEKMDREKVTAFVTVLLGVIGIIMIITG
jgi:uncharacterized membrane protein YfcA/uncharacterized membrane protein YkvA (DUF1232 family)